MSGHLNKEDNLDQIYSDFSEKEQQPVRKNSSASNTPSGVAPSAIRMPSFLGGRNFIPPPPPSSSKPKQSNAIPNQIFQHRPNATNFNQQSQQNQRQRKSTIFIKNIPKSCNRQQTLTTYFRTYGNIKSIKTNEQSCTAVVRFQRQQDAYRFMTNKPLILNRSYIKYDINDDFTVPSSCIAQREKDQAGIVNACQKQNIILRQNTQHLIADKYRCLLFLKKHFDQISKQQCNQVEKQMANCRKIKQIQSNKKQLTEMLIQFQNNYDWTLCYRIITKQPIQKKKVIQQFNKYGPIGNLTVKLTSISGNATTDQSTDGIQDKQAIIRIKFLGVKSSWKMYLQNKQTLNLEVEGLKLNSIYLSWYLKKQKEQEQEVKAGKQLNQEQNQEQQENQQDPQPNQDEYQIQIKDSLAQGQKFQIQIKDPHLHQVQQKQMPKKDSIPVDASNKQSDEKNQNNQETLKTLISRQQKLEIKGQEINNIEEDINKKQENQEIKQPEK